jgi:hypothetical protein
MNKNRTVFFVFLLVHGTFFYSSQQTNIPSPVKNQFDLGQALRGQQGIQNNQSNKPLDLAVALRRPNLPSYNETLSNSRRK